MKHLGFTIQFFLLLIAIPLLMYVEMTRDIREQPKEGTNNQVEVALKERPASIEHDTISFVLIN